MSEQDSHNPTDPELDETLDSLLSKQVIPSKDFTQRILSGIQDDKIAKGPWIKPAHWLATIAATAAAAVITVGLTSTQSPSQIETYTEEQSIDNESLFLEFVEDPEFVDEMPNHTIESLLDENESLDAIDALLDQPQLIDINILLES